MIGYFNLNKDFYKQNITKETNDKAIQVYLFFAENKNYENKCKCNIDMLLDMLNLSNNKENRGMVVSSINSLIEMNSITSSIPIDIQGKTKATIEITLNNNFKSYVRLPLGIVKLNKCLSAQALNLFIYLRSQEDIKLGYAFPSQEIMYNTISMTNKTVQRYTKELLDIGLIKIDGAKFNKDKGRYENIKYYVQHNKLCELLGLDYSEYVKEFGIVTDGTNNIEIQEINKVKIIADASENSSSNKEKQPQFSELKGRISKIIGVDTNSIVLSKEIKGQLEIYGDNALLSAISQHWNDKYKWIWNYDKMKNDGAKVSLLFKKLIGDHEIENEFNQMQKQKGDEEKQLSINTMSGLVYINNELTNIAPEHRDIFIKEIRKVCEKHELEFDELVKTFKNTDFQHYDYVNETDRDGIFSVKTKDIGKITSNIRSIIDENDSENTGFMW